MTEFQTGDRVELVRTSDAFTKLKPGDRGRVTRISRHDDNWPPVIQVNWDNGSTLAMLSDEGDVIRKVEDSLEKGD